MWEYKEETISVLDTEDVDLIGLMDKFGKEKWEIFSITESETSRDRYDSKEITKHYKMYMKRLCE